MRASTLKLTRALFLESLAIFMESSIRDVFNVVRQKLDEQTRLLAVVLKDSGPVLEMRKISLQKLFQHRSTGSRGEESVIAEKFDCARAEEWSEIQNFHGGSSGFWILAVLLLSETLR